MPTVLQKVISVFAIVAMLGACAATTETKVRVISQNKPALEVPEAEIPLTNLKNVEWKVVIIDDKPLYVLDDKGYTALAKNFELIQNKLYIQHTTIQKYKDYYK